MLPQAGIFTVVSETPSPGDKVPVFFMGAQGCPFCAAERWALVGALQKFGTLTNWGKEAHNEGTFGFKLVPTYDLLEARYDSPYISLMHVEILDHQGKPFQKLDASEQDYIDRFDPKASFPFLIINGQYAFSGPGRAGYSPAVIDGQTFDAVKQQLDSGADTPAVRAITAEAQVIINYLCASTGGAPVSVCKA